MMASILEKADLLEIAVLLDGGELVREGKCIKEGEVYLSIYGISNIVYKARSPRRLTIS